MAASSIGKDDTFSMYKAEFNSQCGHTSLIGPTDRASPCEGEVCEFNSYMGHYVIIMVNILVN